MRKRKYTVVIWFDRDPKTGELYELESIKLKLKPMTLGAAKKIAIKEAKKCWPHFEIELSG